MAWLQHNWEVDTELWRWRSLIRRRKQGWVLGYGFWAIYYSMSLLQYVFSHNLSSSEIIWHSHAAEHSEWHDGTTTRHFESRNHNFMVWDRAGRQMHGLGSSFCCFHLVGKIRVLRRGYREAYIYAFIVTSEHLVTTRLHRSSSSYHINATVRWAQDRTLMGPQIKAVSLATSRVTGPDITVCLFLWF